MEFYLRKDLNFIAKWWLDIDKVNLFLIISLMLFGILMTVTSSTYIAQKIGVSKFYFIKKQIFFTTLALLILITISFLNTNLIKICAILGIFSIILLLIAVLVFGSEAKGAKRWLSIFGFSLQPSEFSKTFFIIFNAYLLDKFYQKKWYLKYSSSLLLFAVIISLLIAQPDFGMSLLLTLIWLSQLFLYGLPLMLITLILLITVVGSIYAYIKLPHVTDRINRFLDKSSENYQVEKSMDAFSNGGFFGQGPGEGVVKKHIPDAHTDFIFAVIVEEFGMIGAIVILAIIFTIISRVIFKNLKQNDLFIYLALSGLVIQFAFQSLINIGVSMALLPTKGMTLPFISYGGSSILATAFAFGVILALTKKDHGYHLNEKRVMIGNFNRLFRRP